MIYFLQDSRTFSIKIGFTSGDAADRAAALQTGNAAELILLTSFEGDRTRETELHRQFADARIAGEWFHPTSALLSFILLAVRDDALDVGYRAGLKAAEVRAKNALPDHDAQTYALWQIDANEASDSSAGECQFYAITDSSDDLPDVYAAFAAIAASKYSLYMIESVRRVDAFDSRALYSELVHDQRKPRAVTPESLGLPLVEAPSVPHARGDNLNCEYGCRGTGVLFLDATNGRQPEWCPCDISNHFGTGMNSQVLNEWLNR